MVTTLRILGDDHVLTLDEKLFKEWGIDEGTPLDLALEDGRLIVTPAVAGRAPTSEELQEILTDLRKTHTPMMRKLAE